MGNGYGLLKLLAKDQNEAAQQQAQQAQQLAQMQQIAQAGGQIAPLAKALPQETQALLNPQKQ